MKKRTAPLKIKDFKFGPQGWKEELKHWAYFKFVRPGKLTWQYLTRGWSDKDTWSLDFTIADFVFPRLKRLKELKIGHPYGLTEKSWDKIIDKMLFSLQASIDDANGKVPVSPLNKRKWEAYRKKVMEGRHLFAEYFENLWW